ncbi:MAG: hypothetical protein FJ095_02255 [Deltaproteobacteria bacterium]|nr:hypothetical protein [Deltaproteobacteria bacterium]
MSESGRSYRYELHVQIEPTDVGVLVDALEDEEFGLRELLGEEELVARIRSRELTVSERSTSRWASFDHDLEVLSIYLSQYIVGRELELTPTRGAPIVRGEKVVARRGEVIRLALELSWDPSTGEIRDDGEDLAALVERWPDLPEWVRAAMRLTHPRLRAL